MYQKDIYMSAESAVLLSDVFIFWFLVIFINRKDDDKLYRIK